MTQREEMRALRSLLIRWIAATEDSTDEAVRRLAEETGEALSTDVRQAGQEKFTEFLQQASMEVAMWPGWKRCVLGKADVTQAPPLRR